MVRALMAGGAMLAALVAFSIVIKALDKVFNIGPGRPPRSFATHLLVTTCAVAVSATVFVVGGIAALSY